MYTLQTLIVGQVGISPRVIHLSSDDSYDTITTSNYLSNAANMGNPIQPTDFILCTYANNAFQIFIPVMTSSSITLVPWPVNANKAVSYTGSLTNGDLMQATATPGVFSDSGVAANNVTLLSNRYSQIVSWAGGSTTNVFTVSGVTASSVPQASFSNKANLSAIDGITPGTNTITIRFTADPGACTINLSVDRVPFA